MIDRRPDLTIRFYEILFAKYPQLEPMFRRDRTSQARMLAGAIAAVLDHLEDAPWLQPTLGDLGAKHVAYGVTDAMYAMVGDALLATFAEIAAEAWTPIVAEQWTLAYGAIASKAGRRGVARHGGVLEPTGDREPLTGPPRARTGAAPRARAEGSGASQPAWIGRQDGRLGRARALRLRTPWPRSGSCWPRIATFAGCSSRAWCRWQGTGSRSSPSPIW